MATGMTCEVDGTPPLKKRKSIAEADTHTALPSASRWVQTFDRLAAPFFRVPAFTSPPVAPPPQKKVIPPPQQVVPQKPDSYKHIFGANGKAPVFTLNAKAPVFTFTPHGNQKLFPSFQNALQGPQLPSKPSTAAPSNDTLDNASATSRGVARSSSDKLRRICAFFSKPTPIPATATAPPPIAQPAPTANPVAQPAPTASAAARPVPVAHTVAPLVPTAQPVSATQNAAVTTRAVLPRAPQSNLETIHKSCGMVQYKNIDTGEVFTVGPDGRINMSTPAHIGSGHTSTQPAGPPASARSARSDAGASVQANVHTAILPANMSASNQSGGGTAAVPRSQVGFTPWRAPPPAHLALSSQPATKRSHDQAMSMVPSRPPHGSRDTRKIATAVARLHRLSLDDPAFLRAVELVEHFTQYRFYSLEYIREALHSPRMPVSIGNRICLQGNQRLAMLGDSLLRLAVLEEWHGRVQYCRGDTEHEGSRLWCNASLYRIGRFYSVDEILWSLCQGMRMGRRNNSEIIIVATAMEAILGAIWLDCGKELAVIKRVVRLWFARDLYR